MNSIIFDIEVSNHLDKDCKGDFSKLKLGVAGIKILDKDEFYFFSSEEIGALKKTLEEADLIIGYNLIGYNGIDYKVLENYGFDTKNIKKKTYDLMSVLINNFGTYDYLSFSNIIKHTFGEVKKPNKESNYKLIQSGQILKVEENLKQELMLIEKLFGTINKGGLIRFETPAGHIEEQEINPNLNSDPAEIIEPCDIPFVGMRLQVKKRTNVTIKCEECAQEWNIKSVSYFGDSMPEKMNCPICKNFLTEVNSSLFGPEVIIKNVNALPLDFVQKQFKTMGLSLKDVQITDNESSIEIEDDFSIVIINSSDVHLIQKANGMAVFVEINDLFKKYNLKKGDNIHAKIYSEVDNNKLTSVWNFVEISRL